MEILANIFSTVCGQNPDHTWAPGGLMLPCCQRCTGLYAGAALAALLQTWLKPPFTKRFLEWHGLFLLIMVPFGFHWVDQGPVLRTITGALFGAGLVCFLKLGAGGGGEPKPAALAAQGAFGTQRGPSTTERREAFGVRGISALSKAVEYTALQTLRELGDVARNSGCRMFRKVRSVCGRCEHNSVLYLLLVVAGAGMLPALARTGKAAVAWGLAAWCALGALVLLLLVLRVLWSIFRTLLEGMGNRRVRSRAFHLWRVPRPPTP